MQRTIRKQTRNDFESRIQRLDPKFAAKKPAERYEAKPWETVEKKGFRAEKPFTMTMIGMVLAVLALYGFYNPEGLKSALLQSGWPAQFLTYAMNGTAILSIGLVFLLVGNVFRIFNPNATGRWNAGGLVAGSLAGILAYNIPDPYVQQGYAYLGFQDANDVLDYAQERTLQLANIDWASVVLVSSAAK